MIYKLRVILDVEEDVFRDIEIESTSILLDLNDAIKNSFLLEGEEMSAFYLSDDDWTQGEAFLMDDSFSESESESKHMLNTSLDQILHSNSKRLLFIYDFLLINTFFVELMEEREGQLDYPMTVYEFGEKPEKKMDESQPSDLDFSLPDDEDNFGDLPMDNVDDLGVDF